VRQVDADQIQLVLRQPRFRRFIDLLRLQRFPVAFLERLLVEGFRLLFGQEPLR
jgi:hypothetical protein